MASKRRGNNEGSLFKRPNGTWRAQISLDGKRVSFCAPSRSECLAWLKEKNSQIDRGLTYDGTKLTYSSFIENWLIYKEPYVRPRTIKQYKRILKTHILPELGHKIISEITPRTLQEFYLCKRSSDTGQRTCEICHAIIHSTLDHAIKLGLIVHNPTNIIKPHKAKVKEMQFFNEDQTSQFILAIQNHRLEALFFLAVTTGMRQGELLGLKWSDLDTKYERLSIVRQLKRGFSKGDYFESPKTQNGRRVIALGKVALQKLHDHQLQQLLEKQFAGDRWEENDLIFTTKMGTPIDHSNIYRYFKEIIREAQLPDIRFHDLRHTAASLMLNHGTPPIIVSRRLGHSKVSITLDTYGHLMPEMQYEFAQKIEELVTPIPVELHQTAP